MTPDIEPFGALIYDLSMLKGHEDALVDFHEFYTPAQKTRWVAFFLYPDKRAPLWVHFAGSFEAFVVHQSTGWTWLYDDALKLPDRVIPRALFRVHLPFSSEVFDKVGVDPLRDLIIGPDPGA